jgi:hypothetical protein
MEKLRKERTSYASLLPTDLSKKIDKETERLNKKNLEMYKFLINTWLSGNELHDYYAEQFNAMFKKYNIKAALEIIDKNDYNLYFNDEAIVSTEAVIDFLEYYLKYGAIYNRVERANKKFTELGFNIRVIQKENRQVWLRREKPKPSLYEIVYVDIIKEV